MIQSTTSHTLNGIQTLDDLIEKIRAYNASGDFDLLRKAYVYSAKVHKGQNRKSGEPYFVHPFEVAKILIELRQDVATVATGFLHDTVEDTLATLEDVEVLFGKEVAFLVDGVTKLGKISFSTRVETQAENFRKMLMAMAKDIRVILIKLADRTHNMRTLGHLSRAKQEEVSLETMEIYAPLASRLGIMWLRTELEDLALKYLKPQIYENLGKELRRFGKAKEKYIDNVAKLIRERLTHAGLECEVSGRLKNIGGIYRKMENRSLTFDQINDVVAFRIIVDEVAECYEALGHVHALWKPVPGRFKDYIAMPKDNLYQSLHTTVIGPYGERVEIQIRSREMHRIAEEGIAAHWKYKEGGKVDEKELKRFHWLRQLIEWQSELKDPNEFLQSVKEDLFDEYVYVFTPTGEVLSFPKGSTPVDFAYAIHTQVGNQCVGAKVNGRIVPLKHKLRSGETVEILTQKNSKPNKDWLKYAASTKARNNIRSYLKKEEQQKSIVVGKELLEEELRKYGQGLNKLLKEGKISEVVSRFNQGSLENFYANLARENINFKQVLPILVPKERLAEGPQATEEKSAGALQRIFQRVSGGRSGIKINGHEDVMTHFGRCCNPLPGDEIVGFVTRGKGVTVHTAECPMNLANDDERRIVVEWDENDRTLHTTKIRTVCVDRPGLLAKLSRAITLSGVNISEAKIKTTRDQKAVNTFTVSVEDVGHLRRLIQKLEEVDGVIKVERVAK